MKIMRIIYLEIMRIEFTNEYEKLLVEAQEKHKAYKREADSNYQNLFWRRFRDY